jgi:protein-S-isoprenylcysteine O-methyltransferase Ste14
MLFARALVSFLVLPGVVAGLIPWLIVSSNDFEPTDGWPWPGLGVLSTGLAILLWCVRDFYVTGKGTLAPWDPPLALVGVGLYRYVRNPMYVGVLILVAGWAILVGSRALALYWLALIVIFHLRVVFFEEAWLAKSFPAEWNAYRAAVPRWLPRISTGTRAERRDGER